MPKPRFTYSYSSPYCFISLIDYKLKYLFEIPFNLTLILNLFVYMFIIIIIQEKTKNKFKLYSENVRCHFHRCYD